MDRTQIQQALKHLRTSDPVMRDLIKQAGPFRMKLRRDRFKALVFSILAQQISSKAAMAIRTRLEQFVEPEGLSPERIVRLTKEELRSVGISNQKATYLLDLANRVASGELRLDRIARLSDEKVIEALIQIKGIGVWTAQMFLIFSLGRPDVFPHDDFGVRSAIKNLYGLDELPNKAASHLIAEAWRPYASIASWYCWRSLDLKRKTS